MLFNNILLVISFHYLYQILIENFLPYKTATFVIKIAKPRAPVIRISSSAGLLVYGPELPPDGKAEKQQQQQQRKFLTVVAQQNAQISLKCDLQFNPNYGQNYQQEATSKDNSDNHSSSSLPAHKVMWYINNAFVHSSGPQELFNLTLKSTAKRRNKLKLLDLKQKLPLRKISAESSGSGSTDFNGSNQDNVGILLNLNSNLNSNPDDVPIFDAAPSNDNDRNRAADGYNNYDNNDNRRRQQQQSDDDDQEEIGDDEEEEEDGDKELKFLGTISCAHHILGSTNDNNGDNFHGSLMRVYQSSNQMDLKLQVGPKLLPVNRRAGGGGGGDADLMPPVRSFSKLELETNPTKKLKLLCVAQCEPLCSIDWYFGFKPPDDSGGSAEGAHTSPKASVPDMIKFKAISSSTLSPSENSGEIYHRELNNKTILFSYRNQNHITATSDLLPDYDLSNNNVNNFKLSLIENLIHKQSQNLFSWYKQTFLEFLSPDLSPKANAKTPLETLSRQFSKELADLQMGRPSLKRANVISKLELTYNQLWALLNNNSKSLTRTRAATEHDDYVKEDNDEPEIQFRCQLNYSLARGFVYKIIKPENWFSLDYNDSEEADGEDELANSIKTTQMDSAAATTKSTINKLFNKSYLQTNYNMTPLNLNLFNNQQQQQHLNSMLVKVKILSNKPLKNVGKFSENTMMMMLKTTTTSGLNVTSKQTTLGLAKPALTSPISTLSTSDSSSTAAAKSLSSMFPITNTNYLGPDLSLKPLSIFNSSIGHPIELSGTASQPVVSVIRFLWSKSEWLLGFAFALIIFAILFMFVTSFAKRKYNPQRKLQTLTRSTMHNGGQRDHDLNNSSFAWRFSSSERHPSAAYSANNSSNGTLINYGLPLSGSQQSTKLYQNNNSTTIQAGNYYGNFNSNNNNNNSCAKNDMQSMVGDSSVLATLNGVTDYREHNPVQSCSQSLSSRTFKQHHQQQQMTNTRNEINHKASNSAAGGGGGAGHYSTSRGLTLLTSSNVPLINGTHNSRINLDHQQQSRFIRTDYNNLDQQQSFNIASGPNSSSHVKGTHINYNEPIYDDVIYNNQMVL